MFHYLYKYKPFRFIQPGNAFLGENKRKHKSVPFLGQLPLFAFGLAKPQRLTLFRIP
jgi:hypothetical protein